MLTLDQNKHMNTRTCEICGQEFVADYGFSLAVCWLVTGHAHISSFMCEGQAGGQHWGCTPEHALQAAVECATMHMMPQLNGKYEDCRNTNKGRVAEVHKPFLDESKDNFHFVGDKK